MKVQMSSLNELENHVAQNLSCQIKTDLFWTKTFGCFCRLRKASVQDHFDTSQYPNVWIQRRLKWFSFAVYCHFWVFHREIIKYSCRTWSSCRTLNLVNKVLFKVTSERTHICPSEIFKLQTYGSENARFPLKILIDRQEEGTHRPSWNIQGAAFNKISPQYNSLGFSFIYQQFLKEICIKWWT